MKIFKEGNGLIRLQLKDMKKNVMLFAFIVEETEFPELKEHMIEHLNNFKI